MWTRRLALLMLLCVCQSPTTAAPAPLPRPIKYLTWPQGDWLLVNKNNVTTLSLLRGGEAVERWNMTVNRWRWGIEKDHTVLVFNERGGVMYCLRDGGTNRLLTSYPYDSAVFIRIRKLPR